MIEDFLPIIYLFVFIGLGLLSKIIFGEKKIFMGFIGYLSHFVYYILVPIVFFDVFSVRGLMIADLGIFGVSTTYVLVSIFALSIITRRFEEKVGKALIITSTFQNAVFLGFPVMILLYNDLSAAATYSLLLFIYHIVTAGLLSTGRGNIVGSIIRIPILYGFLSGTLIHYVVPSGIVDGLHVILSPSHPLLSYSAVYVLGSTIPLTTSIIRNSLSEILLIGIWRFIVSPIIHFILLMFLQLPQLYEAEIMVLSVMPPAVMNTVLARIYGWRPELVAGATMVHTFIGLIIVVGIVLLS